MLLLIKNYCKQCILLLLLLMGSWTVTGQSLETIRHAKTNIHKMDFHILLSAKKIRYNNELDYTWFKSQKIMETQGRSSGNLLHGKFSMFYMDGQLAEQGEFKYGVKNGQWSAWYSNGKYKTIVNYKKGRLHGYYANYDEDGNIIAEGKYKKGEEKIKKTRAEKAAIKENKIKEKAEDKDSTQQKDPFFKRFSKKKEDVDTPENDEKEQNKELKRLEKQQNREKKKKEREIAREEAKQKLAPINR